MVRETAITLYLLFFRIVFSFFNLFPIERKVVFVTTFGDNNHYVLKEVIKHDPSIKTVVLKSKSCHYQFNDLTSTILIFNSSNPMMVLKSIYHLATSKFVIVDNYYGFLAAASFRKEVECIQVWHAAGAIKKFGLRDPSNSSRSRRANKRFKQVYHNFHKVIVGSEGLTQIYNEAFDVKDHHILRLGIPRTDLFYDQEKMRLIRNELLRAIPAARDKKVLLYAPTYREQDLNHFTLHLDIQELHRQFSDTHILVVKLHRAIRNEQNLEEEFKGFVHDLSSYPNINDLLVITDCLITDYSSVPFEYSILEKPMIFFPYDLEAYSLERGFWEDYEGFVPGPIAYDTSEIVNIIKENRFDQEAIKEFKDHWNSYSKGNASYLLAKYLIDHIDE
ncbi:CDP-glycerol glycerophosphotransferase family protein [[Bacillus] enclensis]|uniref:CDP-glycerol glycerophosphotransferase family protein n=1 Tax=[Bacillus] enclensis TaxID=1402860 RepID=UPI0018DDDB2A|nr:CDP-glycerol glycerophosphotransferase family protein [[Bacillus] enclensis]MBH9966632.1 CDP-glycerol glycerophosphotransferase family protein [[Bacillus] enclensis]